MDDRAQTILLRPSGSLPMNDVASVSIQVVGHATGGRIYGLLDLLPAEIMDHSLQVRALLNTRCDEVPTFTHARATVASRVKPSGFAANHNFLMRDADGCEYVVLVNHDLYWDNALLAAIERLLSLLGSAPEAGCAASALSDPTGALQDSSYSEPGVAALIFGSSPVLFIRHRLSRLLTKKPVWEKVNEVDWVPFALVALRQSALAEVGVLDERFHMYFEDVDLCRRMRKAGWKVMLDCSERVIHDQGASFENDAARWFEWRTSLRGYLLKWHSRPYYFGYRGSLMALTVIERLWLGLSRVSPWADDEELLRRKRAWALQYAPLRRW